MEKIKSYRSLSFFYKIPFISGFLGLLIALIVSQLITLKEYQILLKQEEEDVLSFSSILEDKISNVLNNAYSAASILAFLHERVDFEKEFDKIGEDILDRLPQIDAVQWNEDGIIKYVYPLEGNEASIGFDIFNDTITNKHIEAFLAIEKGELFFAGPFELKQGGMGIVGRLPVNKDGKFFGFSVIIIRLDTFFKLLDYDPEDDSKYYVQFSKVNPGTNEEEFFLPIETGNDGFQHVRQINAGNWILSVQLRQSEAFNKVLPEFILRVLFSILFGLAIFYLAKMPSILEKEVAKKSKELRKTIKRFKMVSKATSDATWEWDFAKNKIYRSGNFVKLFGYSYSFFNKNQEVFDKLIHPDDQERVENHFNDFLKGKDNLWQLEFRFLKENGEYAYVLDKGILHRGKDGSPNKFYGAVQDITLLKERELDLEKLTQKLDQRAKDLELAFHQLEESEKRYRELFELSPLPMWVYDLETLQFLDINNAAITAYGYTRDQFLSKTIKDIRPVEDIPALEESVYRRKERSGLFFSGVYRHLKKNGELIEVEISSNKIQYNGIPAVLVLVVDVTLRNKYIGAIEIQNSKLKEIAWIQSHVVRAPLARLIGLVDLLEMEKRDNPEKTVASFEELFGYIKTSASELDEIIKEITTKTERIDLG
ncbi:PAS domain S-box protein [Fontibacter flavus]|uniref:histidine kinase n=1 Tax=Fontibacter flavus TaxID=654838 RepID=A0ABV6FYI0_9BACT